jgi:phosphoglycerate dehydrogenase-like enzyme
MMVGCAAAIVSTDPFTDRVISSNPSLRVIARVGVGIDSIDLAAANARRVAVTVTPGMNAETVADHTLALMLALVRKIVTQDLGVKRGEWSRIGPSTPGELHEKTVGLVGAGTIGRAVYRRLIGFGARVIFLDEKVPSLGIATKATSLGELLGTADIVSLHAPLTAQTRGLINASALKQMKRTAFLINTARGPLIDEAALYSALREHIVAGAALDVFQDEPPDPTTISNIPNLITSAHVGGLSVESIQRMTVSATSSVLDVLSGRLPDTVVNRLTLSSQRSI